MPENQDGSTTSSGADPTHQTKNNEPTTRTFWILSGLAVVAALAACTVAITLEHWSAILLAASAVLLVSQTFRYRSYSRVLAGVVVVLAAVSAMILIVD